MKAHKFMPPLPRRSAGSGFTLVELMIALTLGLLIVAGVTSLFIGMRASYSFQEGLSRVQENGRFALQTLRRELRMAGYEGCVDSDLITSWLNPAGAGYSEALFGRRPITAWEASGTAAGDNYEIGTATNWSGSHGETVATGLNGLIDTDDLEPGSDIIVLNRALDLDLGVTGPPSSSSANFQVDGPNGLPDGALVVAVPSSCSGGDLWQKQTAPSATTLSRGAGGSPGNTAPQSVPFANEYDNNAYLLTRVSYVFFIRRNPANEPSLYRLTVDGRASPTPEELVSGIESMQALLGEDTDGDETADTYVAADAVTNWANIVSVRMALLLRNDSFVQTESNLRAYDVAYTNVTPVEDGRVRQVMTLTVALRNRLP